MHAFLLPNKENKILFGSPPKKAPAGYEWSRYGYTQKCLFIPAACDLDFY